eukprot:gnl/Dysnectes_brevis/538_a595_3708.p1 GENE.gnl/Dysnectes_brevis/538_a595_3708~~gnl/Dysnectes_brevis/538_a595_3708.p1  ORF type:complete len:167 (+),score=6.81 gnl/Dysnectes_brevis/538_a595_3708:696-1196(+)
MASQAALLLARQLKELQKEPLDGISTGLIEDSDVFRWQVVMMGPQDTPYEGGCFKAILTFPEDYPNSPPKMRFTTPMYHPNIYQDGTVCISILHPPGDDPMRYERPEERWLPVHTICSILLSVSSMLADPNPESPANVDAANLFRNNRRQFRRKVAASVRASQENF